MMQIKISTPRSFNFVRTVFSHGWSELVPFELDQKKWRLLRVIDLPGRRPVSITICRAKGGLRIEAGEELNEAQEAAIAKAVRHMLRLDDDLKPFYAAVDGSENFEWIAREGAGRLLRSPTVFEDLVKMICTTNCSWALTDKMVNALVRLLGSETPDGRRSFPSPEAMAAMPVAFYSNEVRAGYRAGYLKELADQIASGAVDVEGWLTTELATPELKREMKKIKGVGDYAAENVLRLVGRYDGLALDSWIRSKFSRTRNNGRTASDKKIERYYSSFGEWKGLALWCDMTRDWLDGNKAAAS